MKRSTVILTAATVVAGVALSTGTPAFAKTATPAAKVDVLRAAGAFGDGIHTPGFAYDKKTIPAGAAARVLTASAGVTATTLYVSRLLPGHAYGAHLHQKPCGADPTAAGPHYQHVADPVKPSVDPKYANPRNEIWLDFTTTRSGAGVAVAKNPWRYDGRTPASLVIHAEHTSTHPGHAGTAGARLACLTLKPVG